MLVDVIPLTSSAVVGVDFTAAVGFTTGDSVVAWDSAAPARFAGFSLAAFVGTASEVVGAGVGA
ncbi:MAG TPA: hypothetical protein VKB66_02940 [Candidatus Acidoferrum sp.]|nr:hypothetical protein [Candidatus Acidoferrum sp.]